MAPTSTDNASKDLYVIVHGTFDAGASWSRSDGALAHGLREALGEIDVEPFDWSGGNSHQDRIDAGAALRDRLQSLSEGARVHLLAHSHGGNVCLYALNDDQVREIVATVTFMGTPFFRVLPRNVGRNAALLTTIAAACVPIAVAMYVAWRSYQIELSEQRYSPSVVDLPLIPLSALSPEGIISLILGSIVSLGPIIYFGLVRVTKDSTVVISQKLMESQKYLIARYAQAAPACPVYIARVPADEAGLLLASVNSIAAFPWFLIRILRKILLVLIPVQLMTQAILAMDNQGGGEWLAQLWIVIGGLAAAVLVLWPLGVIGSWGLRSPRFAFGGEGLVEGVAIRLSPSPQPVWRPAAESREVVYRASWSTRRWRHCAFFEDKRFLSDIGDWLAKHTKNAVGEARATSVRPRNRKYRLSKLVPVTAWVFAICILTALNIYTAISSASISAESPEHDANYVSKHIELTTGEIEGGANIIMRGTWIIPPHTAIHYRADLNFDAKASCEIRGGLTVPGTSPVRARFTQIDCSQNNSRRGSPLSIEIGAGPSILSIRPEYVGNNPLLAHRERDDSCWRQGGEISLENPSSLPQNASLHLQYTCKSPR